MPAIAAAALARIRPEMELTPATSATEAISVRSVAPMYSVVSPAATVDTMSLGTPTGSARIAAVAIAVLPLPPAASTPLQRPSARSRRTSAAAASAIAVTAAPRSRPSASAARSTPASAATASRPISGSAPCGSKVPTSTSSGRTPAARRRSTRKAHSAPLVSSVPIRTTVCCSATAPPNVASRLATMANVRARLVAVGHQDPTDGVLGTARHEPRQQTSSGSRNSTSGGAASSSSARSRTALVCGAARCASNPARSR